MSPERMFRLAEDVRRMAFEQLDCEPDVGGAVAGEVAQAAQDGYLMALAPLMLSEREYKDFAEEYPELALPLPTAEDDDVCDLSALDEEGTSNATA